MQCKKVKGKCKVIPVRGREGPYGCETSRPPNFLENRFTDGGKIVSLMRRPPFTTQGRFLVLISVRRLKRPQGHNAAAMIRSIEKSSDLIGN
jgi:hypothetical protein